MTPSSLKWTETATYALYSAPASIASAERLADVSPQEIRLRKIWGLEPAVTLFKKPQFEVQQFRRDIQRTGHREEVCMALERVKQICVIDQELRCENIGLPLHKVSVIQIGQLVESADLTIHM